MENWWLWGSTTLPARGYGSSVRAIPPLTSPTNEVHHQRVPFGSTSGTRRKHTSERSRLYIPLHQTTTTPAVSLARELVAVRCRGSTTPATLSFSFLLSLTLLLRDLRCTRDTHLSLQGKRRQRAKSFYLQSSPPGKIFLHRFNYKKKESRLNMLRPREQENTIRHRYTYYSHICIVAKFRQDNEAREIRI